MPPTGRARVLGLCAILLISLVSGLGYSATFDGTLAGRNDPSPIYGVTLDDVSNPRAEVIALSSLARVPTARVVFDTGESPSYYLKAIRQLRPVSYIMGELIDSSYMQHYKSVSAVQSWTSSYVNTLGSQVDIREVGNEINGNWLSKQWNGADVMPKGEAMFDIVFAQGGKTALTFFYEGEPSDPNNCIATDHGGNDMFTWINQRFQLSLPSIRRPAETEKVRSGLNYVLISWYPDQCTGQTPNWPWVYTTLANIFPNAKVGFGEVGTASAELGSNFEINEISTYYPMAKAVSRLPTSYLGGYFWWYFAEEMVPWPGSLGAVLNAALAASP